MKLIIDIPEEDYNFVKKQVANGITNPLKMRIANGTPLPKGHGCLKDELDLDLFAPSLGTGEYIDDLMAKHNIDYVNGDDEDKVRAFATDLIHSCMNVIETAPTIIEANMAESGE